MYRVISRKWPAAAPLLMDGGGTFAAPRGIFLTHERSLLFSFPLPAPCITGKQNSFWRKGRSKQSPSLTLFVRGAASGYLLM